MKSTILKILKVFFIVVAVILVILLSFGLVLSLDWPWWMGFFILLFLAGFGIGGLFIRKIILKRREQQFVQQVIEQDEAQLKNLSGKEKDELKELQERWKEAVEALRKSHLRKQGNPLYVLPWYLVMGESGSGKTTSLNSAHLSSPFAEVSKTSGISGTRNCDWWFFEQAIIIDTAGRYAIPVDEGKDKDEWQRFLSLLLKYRKKEPIHGLIVTVAADKLLSAGHEVLEQDGKNIRRRIDELMRVLGVKFPVYVLVTKCDLVQGMTQFCEHLPEKSLEQAMGVMNRDLSTDAATFLSHTISSVGERLRSLRLLLLHKPESKTVDPGLLLFPEEFENLKQGLEFFMKGAFQENPYQETTILRGIYFSSGRQEGTPYSHFLNALGLIGEKEVLPGTSKGLFLHDFFSLILPKDKGLFAPTRRAIEWNTITRNLGLASWVVLALAICGLLSFSFVKNLKAIREVSHEVAKAPALRGQILEDLVTMDRLRAAVLKMEDQNRNWWIPRFGLNESIKVETALKNKYCKQFQDVFLVSHDKQMTNVMTNFTAATPDDLIGQYIVHLVRRINLLKGRIAGQDVVALQSKPQPLYVSLLATAEQGIEPEIRGKFGFLYLYYLVWRGDTGDINKEITVLQTWLRHLLVLKGSDLHWLVAWVDQQGVVPPVTLADFWGGSSSLPDEKKVPPSFTRKGKEMIDSFVNEFESALPDPVILANTKAVFEKWYSSAYFNSWQDFAGAFSRGSERLRGEKEWQQTAAKMPTEQGPYFALLNKMALEFEPYAKAGSLPQWLQQVYQFQIIKTQAGLASGGVLGKAAEEAKRLVSRFETNVSREVSQAAASQTLTAAKAYKEYQNALTALVPVSTSRNQAYQMASQVYSEDSATSKSPFYVAYGSAAKMKSSMVGGSAAGDIFSRLVTGPLDFLWTFTRRQTACYLQSQWEEKVLAETQGASGQQAIQMLVGADGFAWKFVKGAAAPFLGRNLKGYYSKDALGGAVPFDSSFFSFMSKGARVQASAMTAKQSYNVSIRGLPTDANAEARTKPHSTHLELLCATGSQSLNNLNYPVSKTFNWAPEICTDVVFQIEVGNVLLVKKYVGQQAFPDFLQDFRGGRHTFYASDFPGQKTALERLGISYIKVNYQFSGEQAVLGQTRNISGQAPRNIAPCWDR